MTTAVVPSLLHQQVDRWASDWLQSTFSRLLELRALGPDPFNYPIDVFPEWRSKAFYLRPVSSPEPATRGRLTRMTLTGFGRFDLCQ